MFKFLQWELELLIDLVIVTDDGETEINQKPKINRCIHKSSVNDVKTINKVCYDYVTEHLGRLGDDDRSCGVASTTPNYRSNDDDIITLVVNDRVVKHSGKSEMLVKVFRKRRVCRLAVLQTKKIMRFFVVTLLSSF